MFARLLRAQTLVTRLTGLVVTVLRWLVVLCHAGWLGLRRQVAWDYDDRLGLRNRAQHLELVGLRRQVQA